jgi:hypothetical protein
MSRNGYLLVYFIVFTTSFLGLLGGLTSNWIIDSALSFIFFVLSYSFILIIYESDKKNNIYYSILISIMTLLYFYNLNFLLLIILILYLFLIKRKNFAFDGVKSLFHNFYINIFTVEKIFFILFFISILTYNYFKLH